MKKNNKVTEEEIDVVGSSKRININTTIIFGILTALMLIVSFNVKLKSNKSNVEIDITPSVTTTENMTTTMTTCTSVTTSTSTSVTTTPVTTTIVETTTEEVTTEEECIITIPVDIQVVIDEPVQEESSTEPIIETEPMVEVVEESSNEESIDPPIVEEPVAVEETEPLEMEYIGNLKITGYVATGNPTASGVYPYVGGVAMSRSYGFEWGTTIYIDGLGYYTLFDTGCSYGVVDVFCNTIPECYDLTSCRDVYVVK